MRSFFGYSPEFSDAGVAGLKDFSGTATDNSVLKYDETTQTWSATQTLPDNIVNSENAAFTANALVAATGTALTVNESYVHIGAPYFDLVKYRQRIRNVQDPELDDDVTTKKYVDLLVSTGLSFLSPVRAATNAELATLSGLIVVDGVLLQADDRVLVKNGTVSNPGSLSADNGIYIAQAGAWARSADASAGSPALKITVQAERGDTFAGDLFSCATSANFGDAIEFQQIAFIGNIDGPNTATDEALVRWDGASGRVVQDSAASLTDAGLLTTADVLATSSVAVQNVSAKKTSLVASASAAADFSLTLPAALPAGDSYVTLDASGLLSSQRYNRSSTDPTATDDSTAGFQTGSLWINETEDTSFVCVDSTPANAVWKQTSNAPNVNSGGDVLQGFVYVSTTANIGLSGIGYNIDDLLISDGSRVLVKDQNDPTENGIYIARSGAWERADDALAGAAALGKGYWVQGGTNSGGVVYYVSTGDSFGDALGFSGFLRTLRVFNGTNPPNNGTIARFAVDNQGHFIQGSQVYVTDSGDIGGSYQLELISSGLGNGSVYLRSANSGQQNYTLRFPSSLGSNGGYLLADGGGNSSWLRQAFNFGGNPSSSDNQSSGFYSGSLWTNNVANTAYICTSSSNVSATWKEITAGGASATRYDAIIEVNDIGSGSFATIIRDGGLISSLSKGNSTDGSYLTSVVHLNFNTSLGTNYLAHATLVAGGFGPVPGGIVQVSAINTNYVEFYIRRDGSIVNYIGTRLHVSIIV